MTNFGPESCARQEGCVGGEGLRKIVRFDTASQNNGAAGNATTRELILRPKLPCGSQLVLRTLEGYAVILASILLLITARLRCAGASEEKYVCPFICSRRTAIQPQYTSLPRALALS